MSAASASITPDDIENIWEHARKTNGDKSITGLLLYGRNVFMQCLEGEKSALQALYDKIKTDKRHGALVTLFDGTIEARHFGDWTMGYKQLSTDDQHAIAQDLDWKWASSKLDEITVMSEPASLLKRMKNIYYERTEA